MVGALLNLRRRRPDLEAIGLAGRRIAERHYSLDRMAAAYVEEYAALIASQGARKGGQVQEGFDE